MTWQDAVSWIDITEIAFEIFCKEGTWLIMIYAYLPSVRPYKDIDVLQAKKKWKIVWLLHMQWSPIWNDICRAQFVHDATWPPAAVAAPIVWLQKMSNQRCVLPPPVMTQHCHLRITIRGFALYFMLAATTFRKNLKFEFEVYRPLIAILQREHHSLYSGVHRLTWR